MHVSDVLSQREEAGFGLCLVVLLSRSLLALCLWVNAALFRGIRGQITRFREFPPDHFKFASYFYF